MAKQVALYLRVSTDEQTLANQRRELTAAAERHGWQVVAEFSDAGISGSKGRDQRQGFDRLMQGIARREFDMVASWSVDRLSRSLSHLVTFLGEIHGKVQADEQDGIEQRQADDHGIIAIQRAVHEKDADPRNLEDVFDDKRAGEQIGQHGAGIRYHRQNPDPEDVF